MIALHDITVPPEIINVSIVVFTISLAAIVLLLAILRPKGFLEWAIILKTTSYLLVMLRAMAVIFFDWDRNSVVGSILFILATLATTWFGIVAYSVYWQLRNTRKSWLESSNLFVRAWRDKTKLF